MIHPARLMAYPIPEVRQKIRWQDVALYNIAVGLGQDPLDARQLRFTYEEGLVALPSIATVLGYPGFWLKAPDTGVDWVRVVHGEQSLTLHRPIPTRGEVVGTSRMTRILDKGAGRGALLTYERVLRDAATGEALATLEQTTFARGDGGFGGSPGPAPAPHPEPDRAPDATRDMPTRPEQAALYRLNGDHNPLHIDPAVAAAAGYPRPILHGLCSFGVACHALVAELCGHDVARFGTMAARFSAPVFPGETLRVEIWHEPGGAAFRVRVPERDAVVIRHGLFRHAH